MTIIVNKLSTSNLFEHFWSLIDIIGFRVLSSNSFSVVNPAYCLPVSLAQPILQSNYIDYLFQFFPDCNWKTNSLLPILMSGSRELSSTSTLLRTYSNIVI